MLLDARCRAAARLLQALHIPALGPDQLLKTGHRPAAGDGVLQQVHRLAGAALEARQQEHLHPEGVGDLHEVFRSASLQGLEHLAHLEPVAGGVAERLVHVCDHGHGWQAVQSGCMDDALGQGLGAADLGHKGSPAALDIHHQAVDAFGEFFTENAGGDERDGGDGGGAVAQGVDALVGRDKPLVLADHRHPEVAHLVVKGGRRQLGFKAGDRLQFVEGAAGMAKAAARDHRHLDPCRRHQGGEDEGNLVADAARAVLVDLAA
ncbi:MAG: hypothetical protein BWY77_00309 [bacterium ADurb.Bin431]|nr:MAG: hypothetical protein BWY77_00309 [bacterium ADurb.Bin431]